MTHKKIGFIGLGLMGSAMCRRLISTGYELTVVANRSRPNVDELVGLGATEVSTSKELAEQSDIIMLCVDTSISVESRMYGDNGVIAGLQKGATVIDFGTSLPSSTRKIGVDVAVAGGTYLDAPLGRTPSHAEEGKLNIMSSGDKTAFDSVEPVLKDLGENVFHLGDLGSGHTIKLINNFFAMTIANSMSEAFAMADVTGVDRKIMYDVIAAGPNHSMMMDFIKGYAIDGRPDDLAFAVKNAAKDVGYYASMAEDAGVTSIMSACAKKALSTATENGHGDKMVPEMVDFYSELFSKKPD